MAIEQKRQLQKISTKCNNNKHEISQSYNISIQKNNKWGDCRKPEKKGLKISKILATTKHT